MKGKEKKKNEKKNEKKKIGESLWVFQTLSFCT